jgi:ER lumen protein retaining receptor
MVFMTRYLDLFTTFYSMYNSLMKIVYIVATIYIVILIRYTEPYKTVYNPSQDSFPHWKCAVLPCTMLSFIIHAYGSGRNIDAFSLLEWAWTFSIMLESVAILPQLVVLRKYRLVENLTGKFMFFLGLYRFLYGLNWIVRARTERFFRHHPLVYVCGFLQTLLYVDFFYQYCRISRVSRCCKTDRTSGDEAVDHDDEMDELIFESDRELPTRSPAGQSLLSNIPDHSLVLLEESMDVPEEDVHRRRPTTENLSVGQAS